MLEANAFVKKDSMAMHVKKLVDMKNARKILSAITMVYAIMVHVSVTMVGKVNFAINQFNVPLLFMLLVRQLKTKILCALVMVTVSLDNVCVFQDMVVKIVVPY